MRESCNRQEELGLEVSSCRHPWSPWSTLRFFEVALNKPRLRLFVLQRCSAAFVEALSRSWKNRPSTIPALRHLHILCSPWAIPAKLFQGVTVGLLNVRSGNLLTAHGNGGHAAIHRMRFVCILHALREHID